MDPRWFESSTTLSNFGGIILGGIRPVPREVSLFEKRYTMKTTGM